MKRRHFVAGAAVLTAAVAVPGAASLPVSPAPGPLYPGELPMRTWEILRPVPELLLLPTDGLTEWTRDHRFLRHRGSELAHLPVAETWPRILRAYAAGAVCLHTLCHPSAVDQAALVAEHGPAEAAAMIWREYEAENRADYLAGQDKPRLSLELPPV